MSGAAQLNFRAHVCVHRSNIVSTWAGLGQGPEHTMTVRGAPALIRSVTAGKKYNIDIKSRNFNHDPEDPWAGAALQVSPKP